MKVVEFTKWIFVASLAVFMGVVLLDLIGVSFLILFILAGIASWFFTRGQTRTVKGCTHGSIFLVLIVIILCNYYFSGREKEKLEPSTLSLNQHMDSAAQNLEHQVGGTIENILATNTHQSLNSVTDSAQASSAMSGISKEINTLENGLNEFRQSISKLRNGKNNEVEKSAGYRYEWNSWQPEPDSPLWYRLMWLGTPILVIGLATGARYTYAKNKGVEIIGSAWTNVGLVILLIAYILYLALIPKVTTVTVVEMVAWIATAFMMLSESASWVGRLLFFGLFLSILFGLWSLTHKKGEGGFIRMTAGIGILLVIFSIFLLLFPESQAAMEKIDLESIRIPKVEFSASKFNYPTSTKETETSLSPVSGVDGCLTFAPGEIKKIISLNLDRKTPWIKVPVSAKNWTISPSHNGTEVWFWDGSYYVDGPDKVLWTGLKRGVFRLRGEGEAVVRIEY